MDWHNITEIWRHPACGLPRFVHRMVTRDTGTVPRDWRKYDTPSCERLPARSVCGRG